MRATRRKFFQAMGAAPLMARTAAEEVAKKLTALGGGSGPPLAGGYLQDALKGNGPSNRQEISSPGDWHLVRKMRDDLIRKALDTKQSRAELEAIVYEENRHVWVLDHDLAANRSMSLAAKFTFQRQRNVQRAIREAIQEKSGYSRMMEWRDRILGVAGIKL